MNLSPSFLLNMTTTKMTTTKICLMISLVNLLLFPPVPTIASVNITAIFAFGDSAIDPGNNNLRRSLAKANHNPYGYDFPGHIPTGRFSNGKLFTDILAFKLGLKELLPACMDPNLTDRDLLTGCSFASAGSGLDESTGSQRNILSLQTQISYFEQAKFRVEKVVGLKEAGRVVENGLFLVVSGTNDVVTQPDEFSYGSPVSHDVLLEILEGTIKRFYSMGARKIGIAGLPPVGCLPGVMTLTPSLDILQRVCVSQQNMDAQAYNARVQALMSKIQQTLPGSQIVYVDIYNPLMDMIKNPATYGFEKSKEGCCGTGLLEVGIFCIPLHPICTDRAKYVFWDAVHPTEKAYSYIADYFMQNVLPSLAA